MSTTSKTSLFRIRRGTYPLGPDQREYSDDVYTKAADKNNKKDPQLHSSTGQLNSQIYMSLEDHSITQLMDDIKTQIVPIVDEDSIDSELKKRGLSYEDASKKKPKKRKGHHRSTQCRMQRYYRGTSNDENKVNYVLNKMKHYLLRQKYPTHSSHLQKTRERRSTSTMTLSSTTHTVQGDSKSH
eukprot:5695199-Amphidinium_carterae.1